VRLALGISYRGTGYAGWQSQPSGRTVQDVLETALTRFGNQAIATLCSGRTDTGVHALMQVVHLDSDLIRSEHSWVRGTNRFLPPDVAVEWAREVDPTFHCRASALYRRYSYVLREAAVRTSIDDGLVGWVFRPLDHAAMQSAARHLLGEHDFSSFRASECQAKSPVKTMRAIRISRRGSYWRFDFEANAFLHHMIRNIMGCLILVGQGNRPPDWMLDVLQARDRDRAAPTFGPAGLYFLGPVYEERWGLPVVTPAFDWLP
jgi:tRNA pseudouridine38-40 synthase